jgi:pimeloyl-ACP methyl ester carboxylesterase
LPAIKEANPDCARPVDPPSPFKAPAVERLSERRIAKLIKGARQVVVKDGPHCIPWTHAEEVNAELLSFLGETASILQKDVA